MGRLPLVDPSDPGTPASVATVLEAMREMAGRDFNVLRAVANHAEIFEGLTSFLGAAYALNSLTPAQRELAYLGASVANSCHY